MEALTSRSELKTDPTWRYKGLGKVRTEGCGCEVISYPFGKIVWTGCRIHQPHNEYVCQVCFKKLHTNKELQSHRWSHSQ